MRLELAQESFSMTLLWILVFMGYHSFKVTVLANKPRSLVVTMWAESNKQRLCFSWRFGLQLCSIIFSPPFILWDEFWLQSSSVWRFPDTQLSRFSPPRKSVADSIAELVFTKRAPVYVATWQQTKISVAFIGSLMRHLISGNHWLIMHD